MSSMASGPRKSSRGQSFRALVSEASSAGLESRLGELSLDMTAAVHVAPRSEFVDSLRMRLMAVAAVAPEPAPQRTFSEWAASGTRSARRTRTLTSMVAAAVVVGSAGVAGARSLPGDPFYDVKQVSERVELTFTHGDAARGALHLKFAARRLVELEELTGTSGAQLSAAGAGQLESLTSLAGVKKSTLKAVRETLNAMDRETNAGARLLTTAFELTKDRSTMHTLGSFAQRQAARLQSVVGNLPAQSQSRALNSLSLVLQVQGQAFVLSATAPLTSNTASTPTQAPTLIPDAPEVLAQAPLHTTLHSGRASTTGSASAEPQSAPASSGSASQPSGGSAGSGNGSGSSSAPKPAPSPSEQPTTVNVTLPLGIKTCVGATTLVGLPAVCIVPSSTK